MGDNNTSLQSYSNEPIVNDNKQVEIELKETDTTTTPETEKKKTVSPIEHRLFWWVGFASEIWFAFLFWSVLTRLVRDIFYFNLAVTGINAGLAFAIFFFVPLIFIICPLLNYLGYILFVFRITVIICVVVSVSTNVIVRCIFLGIAYIAFSVLLGAMALHPSACHRERFMWSSMIGIVMLTSLKFMVFSLNILWYQWYINVGATIVGVVACAFLVYEEFKYRKFPDVFKELNAGYEDNFRDRYQKTLKGKNRDVKVKVLRGFQIAIHAVFTTLAFAVLMFLIMVMLTSPAVIPSWIGLKEYPYGLFPIIAFMAGVILSYSKFAQSWLWCLVACIAIVVFCFVETAPSYIAGVVFALTVPAIWNFMFHELYILNLGGVVGVAFALTIYQVFAIIGVRVKGAFPGIGDIYASRSWMSLLPVFFMLLAYLGAFIVRITSKKPIVEMIMMWLLPQSNLSKETPAKQVETIFHFEKPRWAVLGALTAVVIFTLVPAIVLRANSTDIVTASPGDTLRVMSWNVFQGFDMYGNVNVEAVVQRIREKRVHIVGMQETDANHISDDNYAILEYYARNLNMDYFPGLPSSAATVGAGILSSLPMRNNSAVLLPNTNPNSLNRPFLKTNIEFNGVNIPVWNIHVEFLYKEDAILHATTVAQHINATKGPLIVMGDFNAEPDTEVLQIFFATGMKSAYGETHNGNHTITWRPAGGNEKPEVLDYILFRDLIVESAEVASDYPLAAASDHFPVIAQFRLNVTAV